MGVKGEIFLIGKVVKANHDVHRISCGNVGGQTMIWP